jgi:DNA helicase-2/ATP-dependent DNA helicase PcrA
LKENYRSSINVLNAAEKIIPGACDFTNAVIHGIFEIYAAEHEEAETQWIINKIEELVRKGDYKDIEGKVTYDKIAIIARNKYLFKVLAEKLGDIPYYYKITPGAIQFESKLFKIFDLAFKVRLNPKDTLHWHKLLTVLKIKTAESLMEIKEIVKDEWGKMILETVITLEDNGSNFLRTFENLKKTFIASDIEENEKEFILNDIDELRTHWLEYARKTDNKSLLQFKNAMALGKTHPLTQKKGVTLSTVHTMKGQEYDIVFLIGMDDETFPDYRAINDGDIELKQERNNAYVAFTRAKRFLYVTWPKIRHMPWGEDKRRRRSRFLVGF